MKVKNYISYTTISLTLLLGLFLSGCTNAPNPASIEDAPSVAEKVDSTPAPSPTIGHFMLKAPVEMEVGESDDVEVWITTDSIRDAVFFQNNLSENDSITIQKVRIGKVMEVSLIEENTVNSNFSISPLSTPQQLIDTIDAARWKWSVRPLNAGRHQLIVIARIKMMTEDLALIGYKDLPVIAQTITVKIANKPTDKKMILYWFFLIPVIGLLAWFFLKKKKIIAKQTVSAEEFNAFETNIQGFIKRNRIKQAFEFFENFILKHPNEKIENSLVLLKSNYLNNESRLNKNLISNDQYNLERSKIINELLLMIDSFEEK